MDYYQRNVQEIYDIIANGNKQATAIARATLAEVRDAVKI
jgi:hypothetical protein